MRHLTLGQQIATLQQLKDSGVAGHSTKRPVDISNLTSVNPAFADQSLAKAHAICQRVMCEYFSAASEGKLGSIRRNRNNWKMDAATECAELIYQLDQQLRQDAAQAAK